MSATDPNQTLPDYHAWHIKRRIGAMGLLWNRPSDAFFGIRELDAACRGEAFRALEAAGEICPVEVEGISSLLYARQEERFALRAALSDTEYLLRIEFIAPLDSLLWDRRLIEAVLDFDYRWEIYTPEAKRKYDYYVLPLLHGEDFIGRVETVVNDRKGKRLLVKNVWLETGKKLPKHAFRAYLERFAAWNGCKEIVTEREG
ncbi:MAG: winged helix DNA-binding domain-containing protein [Eubacteriales bacterium]|nr:winged helix DNA-binding domain-containing protein [Eubacteriales bacterium]